MIATGVVEEIRRLLKDGLSQRRIASQIGVSRGTVNAIAQGKLVRNTLHRHVNNDGFTPPTGLPVRCPECGCRVQMPCLVCYIRRQAERKRAKPLAPEY